MKKSAILVRGCKNSGLHPFPKFEQPPAGKSADSSLYREILRKQVEDALNSLHTNNTSTNLRSKGNYELWKDQFSQSRASNC